VHIWHLKTKIKDNEGYLMFDYKDFFYSFKYMIEQFREYDSPKHKTIHYPKETGIIKIKSEEIMHAFDDIQRSHAFEIIGSTLFFELDCTDSTRILYEQKKQFLIDEEKRKLEEQEDTKIRERILERERKKQKEKEIYNQLLDEGLIYADEANKRPPIPRDVVDAVWRRDKGQCVYCGSKENLQLDHIIPFSKGGATTFENLQLLCQKCNLKKSNHIG
jgi:hypothetical protein